MRTARTPLDNDAPLARVWQIVADLSRYHEWNPFIVGVDNIPDELVVDHPFRLRVRWHNGRETTSAERFTDITPPADDHARLEYRFDGLLHRTGLVRAVRSQTLQQAPGGPTRYATAEHFTGLLVRFIPLAAVQDGFERHARALKARAEQ